MAAVRASCAVRDHRVFAGRLTRRQLPPLQRLAFAFALLPGFEGDFRDWDDIRTWAVGIAAALQPLSASEAGSGRRKQADRSTAVGGGWASSGQVVSESRPARDRRRW
jgi:hypothetical protein